jgi:glycosyltransferase involved in cell wall biosynthesis
VGNLKPHKGVDTVVDALGSMPDIRLRVFTSDDTRRLEELSATRGVAVEVVPYADDDAVRRAMSSALAVVCPSHYEGAGLSLLDALAMGVPVIATRIAPFDEILGDSGWRFDAGDAAGLVTAVRTLQASTPDQDARTRPPCTWDETAALTRQLYDAAMSDSTG